MQKDSLHVFVVVGMAMSMIMSLMSVIMIVSMAVVRMAKGYKAHDINDETKNADNQKLVEALEFVAFPEAFKGVEDDLQTNQAASN